MIVRTKAARGGMCSSLGFEREGMLGGGGVEVMVIAGLRDGGRVRTR